MTWGVKRAPEARNFPEVPTHRRVGVRDWRKDEARAWLRLRAITTRLLRQVHLALLISAERTRLACPMCLLINKRIEAAYQANHRFDRTLQFLYPERTRMRGGAIFRETLAIFFLCKGAMNTTEAGTEFSVARRRPASAGRSRQ